MANACLSHEISMLLLIYAFFFKQRDQEQYEIYNIYEPFTFIPRKLLKQTNIYYFNVWLRPVILTFGLFVLSPFDLNLASRCVILMWLIRLLLGLTSLSKSFFGWWHNQCIVYSRLWACIKLLSHACLILLAKNGSIASNLQSEMF